jgi:hypothetical protein
MINSESKAGSSSAADALAKLRSGSTQTTDPALALQHLRGAGPAAGDTEPGLKGPGDFLKRAAVGAMATPDLLASVVKLMITPPWQTPEPVSPFTNLARMATGEKPPETFGESFAENVGAMAVPWGGPESWLAHGFQTIISALGMTVGEKAGELSNHPALGGALGAIVAGAAMPGKLIGRAAVKDVAGAEKAARDLSAGAPRDIKVPVPLSTKVAEENARADFARWQDSFTNAWKGSEQAPMRVTGTMESAENALQPSDVMGNANTLRMREAQEFGRRYDELEKPYLDQHLSEDTYMHGGTTASEIASKARNFTTSLPGPVRNTLQRLMQYVSQDEKTGEIRFNEADFQPAKDATTGVTIPAKLTPLAIGDLKAMRDDVRPFLNSAVGPTRHAAEDVYHMLLDMSGMEGVERDPVLNKAYTFFRNSRWPQQVVNATRGMESAANAKSIFMDPERVGSMLDTAKTDAESDTVRRGIIQYALTTPKGIRTISDTFTPPELDKIFGNGAGRAGQVLKVNAFTDELPKLFIHRPDLMQKFVQDSRINALQSFKFLGGNLGKRGLGFAIPGAIGGLLMGGTPGHYAVGIGGLLAARFATRLASYGLASAMERPDYFGKVARSIAAGDARGALRQLAVTGGRALAFESMRGERPAAGPVQPEEP